MELLRPTNKTPQIQLLQQFKEAHWLQTLVDPRSGVFATALLWYMTGFLRTVWDLNIRANDSLLLLLSMQTL